MTLGLNEKNWNREEKTIAFNFTALLSVVFIASANNQASVLLLFYMTVRLYSCKSEVSVSF